MDNHPYRSYHRPALPQCYMNFPFLPEQGWPSPVTQFLVAPESLSLGWNPNTALLSPMQLQIARLQSAVTFNEMAKGKFQDWLRPKTTAVPLSPTDAEKKAPISHSIDNILHKDNKWPSKQFPDIKLVKYRCNKCSKTYSTFAGYSKHRQSECTTSSKTFVCKHCSKGYPSLGALKTHLRSHTLPCKCTLCGKQFSRRWLLEGHMRTHTGEKPFVCELCGSAFADRSNCRAHRETHKEIKKFECSHCNKSFARLALLTKHFVTSHGSVPS